MTVPSDYVGMYGQDYTRGVLSDHLYHFAGQGNGEQVDETGHLTVTVDGVEEPVLCSEIIAIHTEDGPMSGRCGYRVLPGDFACESHQLEIDSYRSMSEMERLDLERREEGYR